MGMKYKVALGVIGTVIVIGGVVYFVNKSRKNRHDKVESDAKDVQKTDSDEIVKLQNVSRTESEFNTAKSEVAEKISERHEEAKKVMREAVNTIYDDTLPDTTKNEDKKNKILEDLDNL